jgi:predicted dinucleotide-binding enzyme
MNISIIGAGNIGGTLGRKWAAAGHTVVFGVRDPQAEKVQALLAQIEGEVTAPSTHSGQAVASLITDIGLRPIYIGGLEQADLLDKLTRLWFTLALQQGRGRHLALKLLEPSTQ